MPIFFLLPNITVIKDKSLNRSAPSLKLYKILIATLNIGSVKMDTERLKTFQC